MMTWDDPPNVAQPEPEQPDQGALTRAQRRRAARAAQRSPFTLTYWSPAGNRQQRRRRKRNA